MPYYRFAPTDKFVNTLVTHPSIEFVIYSGSAYYNQEVTLSGAFEPMVKHMSASGYVSLYEYNIDRPGTADQLQNPIPWNSAVGNTGLIYPWTVKDSTRIAFRTVTNQTYNTFDHGDIISGSYPMSASISKEYYPASLPRRTPDDVDPSSSPPADEFPDDIRSSGSVSHLYALQNTMNNYRYISPHYAVSSSFIGGGRDLTASTADRQAAGPINGCPSCGDPRSIPGAIDVGLISIPSIFYGSAIDKGSVKLQFYVTGTLMGELHDTNKNGELIQSSGAISANDGQIAGVVLYNEGFIVLTGSWALGTHTEVYVEGASAAAPAWTYFGQSISGSIMATSSSFGLHMSGTTKTQTLTLLANAKKGKLNHSNNPTYLTRGGHPGDTRPSISSEYTQFRKQNIKNIVSSSYNDPTGSFKKTTYISKVGIYDENKNLIGIAKVATPVKKTEERDFTFKLKLDI